MRLASTGNAATSQDSERIETTVVGSYPVPDWLVASPTEQALEDATRAVLHTQQQAGIDLVCDGELTRFDVNHPGTNGMIDYFVAPMAGMRTAITFDELTAYRAQAGMGFRRRPPGVVDGALGSGTLDLPATCGRARALTAAPLKFTLTGPHMLAKTLLDTHYGDLAALTDAIAGVLAEQVAHRPASELAAFADLDPRIGMGLGVIDVKRTDIETADDVARAIEAAATAIGPGRVRYVHPDCGFWMLKRPIAEAKMRALVAVRDLYEGR